MTRWSHSCVRLEHNGGTLTIDPGIWAETEAFNAPGAVLLTHDHHDHADADRLRREHATVTAPASSWLPGLDYTAVEAGQSLELSGFTIRTVGGRHAEVIAGESAGPNLGYLIAGVLYHPGDALHVPTGHIDTVLVPMQASWLKTAEAIDFLHRIDARLAVGIHDAQINDRALASINHWLSKCGGLEYQWVTPGSSIEIG